MIELRVVMPKSVTKPTSEPMVSPPSPGSPSTLVSQTASTPPTSANGTLASTSSRFRALPKAIASSSRMPTAAMAEWSSSCRCASAFAWAAPLNTA